MKKFSYCTALACLLGLILLVLPASAEEESGAMTLPTSLKIIEEEAFYGTQLIDKVVIPEGVTEIHGRAFVGCSLTEVVLPSSLTYIADDAFDVAADLNVSVPEDCYAYYRCVELGLIDEAELEPTPEEYFTYKVIDDTHCLVTGYTGTATDVIIPETLDGYTVRKIGGGAFASCTSLKCVTIPESVISIGEYAFDNCANLKTVIIHEGVEEMFYAFRGCTSIEDIYIPSSIVDGRAAFYGCTGLKSVTFASGLNTIPSNIFQNCGNLVEVSLPEGVTEIGSAAFYGCNSLTSIVLPKTIVSIGSSAFYNCSKLENVEIPDGLTTICDNTFYGCNSLESITIPDSVKTIQYMAFYNCSTLNDVTMSANVYAFGTYAFTGCDDLNMIVVEGSYAHEWCIANSVAFSLRVAGTTTTPSPTPTVTALPTAMPTTEPTATPTIEPTTAPTIEPVIVVSATPKYEWYVAGEESEWVIEITGGIEPYSVEYVVVYEKYSGGGSIKDLENATVIFGEAGDVLLRFIAWDANGKNSGYYDVKVCVEDRLYMDYELKDDGTYIITSFYGPDENMNVVIPERIKDKAVTEIAENVFSHRNNIYTVTIPGSVTHIGESAFANCDELKKVVLLDGIQSIGDDAFSGCTGLETVNWPQGLISIGADAFRECVSLAEVVLPDGLQQVNKSAFYGTGIATLVIPGTVSTIGDYAFANCISLVDVQFGDGIDTIPSSAFERCISLREIVLPDSLVDLGKHAFSETALSTISLPGSLKTVSDYAFMLCEQLHTVEMQEGIETIGVQAFCHCTSLSTILLPETMCEIDEFAFSSCPNLYSLSIPINVSKIDQYAFGIFGEIINSYPAEFASVIKPCENLILSVCADSYAEQWAIANGISYRVNEEDLPTQTPTATPSPTPTVTPTVAPTLDIPEVLDAGAESSTTGYVIWSAVDDAVGYRVYRSTTGKDDSYSVIAIVPTEDGVVEYEYTDSSLMPATKYFYMVDAFVGNVASNPSDEWRITTTLDAPDIYVIACGPESISITWDEVKNADSYLICRSYSKDSDFSKIAETDELFYIDSNVEVDIQVYYKVKACAANGITSVFSDRDSDYIDSEDYKEEIEAPDVRSVKSVSSDSLKVSWNSIDNAVKYQVHRSTQGASKGFEKVAETSATSYTDTGLEADTKYWYRIVAVSGSGTVSVKGVVGSGVTGADSGSSDDETEETVPALDMSDAVLDKVVYAPGDTIVISGIQIRNTDYVHFSGNNGFVTVTDVEVSNRTSYRTMSDVKLTLSEYAVEGEFYISVTAYDDAGNASDIDKSLKYAVVLDAMDSTEPDDEPDDSMETSVKWTASLSGTTKIIVSVVSGAPDAASDYLFIAEDANGAHYSAKIPAGDTSATFGIVSDLEMPRAAKYSLFVLPVGVQLTDENRPLYFINDIVVPLFTGKMVTAVYSGNTNVQDTEKLYLGDDITIHWDGSYGVNHAHVAVELNSTTVFSHTYDHDGPGTIVLTAEELNASEGDILFVTVTVDPNAVSTARSTIHPATYTWKGTFTAKPTKGYVIELIWDGTTTDVTNSYFHMSTAGGRNNYFGLRAKLDGETLDLTNPNNGEYEWRLQTGIEKLENSWYIGIGYDLTEDPKTGYFKGYHDDHWVLKTKQGDGYTFYFNEKLNGVKGGINLVKLATATESEKQVAHVTIQIHTSTDLVSGKDVGYSAADREYTINVALPPNLKSVWPTLSLAQKRLWFDLKCKRNLIESTITSYSVEAFVDAWDADLYRRFANGVVNFTLVAGQTVSNALSDMLSFVMTRAEMIGSIPQGDIAQTLTLMERAHKCISNGKVVQSLTNTEQYKEAIIAYLQKEMDARASNTNFSSFQNGFMSAAAAGVSDQTITIVADRVEKTYNLMSFLLEKAIEFKPVTDETLLSTSIFDMIYKGTVNMGECRLGDFPVYIVYQTDVVVMKLEELFDLDQLVTIINDGALDQAQYGRIMGYLTGGNTLDDLTPGDKSFIWSLWKWDSKEKVYNAVNPDSRMMRKLSAAMSKYRVDDFLSLGSAAINGYSAWQMVDNYDALLKEFEDYLTLSEDAGGLGINDEEWVDIVLDELATGAAEQAKIAFNAMATSLANDWTTAAIKKALTEAFPKFASKAGTLFSAVTIGIDLGNFLNNSANTYGKMPTFESTYQLYKDAKADLYAALDTYAANPNTTTFANVERCAKLYNVLKGSCIVSMYNIYTSDLTSLRIMYWNAVKYVRNLESAVLQYLVSGDSSKLANLKDPRKENLVQIQQAVESELEQMQLLEQYLFPYAK